MVRSTSSVLPEASFDTVDQGMLRELPVDVHAHGNAGAGGDILDDGGMCAVGSRHMIGEPDPWESTCYDRALPSRSPSSTGLLGLLAEINRMVGLVAAGACHGQRCGLPRP